MLSLVCLNNCLYPCCVFISLFVKTNYVWPIVISVSLSSVYLNHFVQKLYFSSVLLNCFLWCQSMLDLSAKSRVQIWKKNNKRFIIKMVLCLKLTHKWSKENFRASLLVGLGRLGMCPSQCKVAGRSWETYHSWTH